ncbi:SAM-dependent methyltransferase [Gracilinema caldarium]|uniref:Uroporphyrin-III C/tetrapyrrole (Corrin/Porphyrin) methyltransferase n=1 Tax=Gracilinema caldarium (strain ATCC 51460 / DSM 7334 / H1) TaxID=744872 RepID=F8EZA4_GRAC1|nr:SAM-dependent methyltransferase [Gracilinema caldarium]AEJ19696.1 Uroporphyrin-III C/tetrapyrrole (Corrin/Porphyrin) methyltransferase [Gracilinema caldarium DSM 7334]
MKTGTLHLIPSPIGTSMDVLAPYMVAILESVPYIVAEHEKTVRRFLSSHISQEVLAAKTFATLDEHTPFQDIPALLSPLLAGQDGAIISEAGLPCVADPGSALVALAHRHHIRVIPHPGPSSIFQTLMASGLNGQRFMFEGYLPIPEQERSARLKYLEALSGRENMTILWIETPYRVQRLFTSLCATLREETNLTIAQALMTKEEYIFTSTVGEWKQRAPELRKSPTVFAIQALPAVPAKVSKGAGRFKTDRKGRLSGQGKKGMQDNNKGPYGNVDF